MSVYRRMFGRELPCSVRDLLGIGGVSLNSEEHEQLARRAALGQADGSALHRLGLSHLSRQEAELSRKYLSHKSLSHIPAAQLALAVAYEMLGLYQRVGEYLDKAISLAEYGDTARLSLATLLCAAGLAYERAGQWRRAVRSYERALIETPTESFAQNRLIAIRLSQGQISEAVSMLRMVLNQQPADQAARACLGHLLQLDGRADEAMWEYEQALCLEPDTWELPGTVARELSRLEGSDEAVGLLRTLIAAGPEFPDLRLRLGNVHSLRGEDAAACAEYRQALAVHPEYLECHIALARHELGMERAELASDHLFKALAINERHVEIYAALALAQRRCGQEAQAKEMLDSAAQIARNSAVLSARLAMLEMDWAAPMADAALEPDAESVEQLLACNQLMLEKHPSWEDLWVQRGMLLTLPGRRQEAFEAMRQAAMADPANTDAWLHLGLLMHELGRTDDATSALENALDPDRRSAVLHYRLGLICCGDMEFDLAMEKVLGGPGAAADLERRVWVAAESLQMEGTRMRPRSAVWESRGDRVVA